MYLADEDMNQDDELELLRMQGRKIESDVYLMKTNFRYKILELKIEIADLIINQKKYLKTEKSTNKLDYLTNVKTSELRINSLISEIDILNNEIEKLDLMFI